MKIQKVSIVAVDGGMDHIGGVSTEYSDLNYDNTTLFKIKATTEEFNVLITITGKELDNLASMIWRRM